MTFQIHSKFLCLPLRKEFLTSVYNENKDLWEEIQLFQCNESVKSSDEFLVSVQCCSFSPCGKYIAICLSKELIIYDTEKWNKICSTNTERKGISVKFFPKSSVILLAQKSGNVKFFKFSDDKLEKIDLILGHNSMLLDALVSDDEHFVVTCDRDEKIRVSNYPNVYNIQCYCLGHTLFVCCINFLQSDKNILVSSSGDGTLRFWEITTGKELLKYERGSPEKLDSENPSFFSKFKSLKIDDNQSLIAALENKSHSMTILKVICNTNSISINVIHLIEHTYDIWDFEFWQGNLISLRSDKMQPIKMYNLKDNCSESLGSMASLSDSLIQNWDIIFKTYSKRFEGYPLLFQYKKEYDEREGHELKKTKCN